MKNYDIVKWAKELSKELRSCPVPLGTTHDKDLRIYPHSQAMFIDSVLLPKLAQTKDTQQLKAKIYEFRESLEWYRDNVDRGYANGFLNKLVEIQKLSAV